MKSKTNAENASRSSTTLHDRHVASVANSLSRFAVKPSLNIRHLPANFSPVYFKLIFSPGFAAKLNTCRTFNS